MILPLIIFLISFSTVLSAKELRILFIGNSYTFYPSDETSPGLPILVKTLAEAVRPGLQMVVSASTRPNFSFKDHSCHEPTLALLEEQYDHVVLQGQSTECFDLPERFQKDGRHGKNALEPAFSELVAKAKKSSLGPVYVFAHWPWHDSHPDFSFDNKEKWFEPTLAERQDRIDKCYTELAQRHEVKVLFIGREWLRAAESGKVKIEDLYEKDWTHPSLQGSLLAAAVIVQELFFGKN